MSKRENLKKVPLPSVSLEPTVRADRVLSCCDVWGDQEESGIAYLNLYCVGMNLTVHLDMGQAEEIATKLRQRIDEEKELDS